MGEYGISQSIPRFEDPKLLTGGGDFVDDESAHGQLHGFVLRSPHAHTHIRSIDASAALAEPGVVAVVTGREYAQGRLGARSRISGRPSNAAAARTSSCRNSIRWPSTASAWWARVSRSSSQRLQHAGARRGVGWLRGRLRRAACQCRDREGPGADAPVCCGKSWAATEAFVFEIADAATEAGLRRGRHVVEQRFNISRVLANAMEMRGCLAIYDRRTDHYTLRAPIQHPWVARRILASQVIGTQELRVSRIAPDVGGSFGIKATSTRNT